MVSKTEQKWCRAEMASVPSSVAQQQNPRLGKAFTEAGIRQTLHRARQRFTELVLAEVAGSLPTTHPEESEQELIELGLLHISRHAL
jgi:hypothetical protein